MVRGFLAFCRHLGQGFPGAMHSPGRSVPCQERTNLSHKYWQRSYIYHGGALYLKCLDIKIISFLVLRNGVCEQSSRSRQCGACVSSNRILTKITSDRSLLEGSWDRKRGGNWLNTCEITGTVRELVFTVTPDAMSVLCKTRPKSQNPSTEFELGGRDVQVASLKWYVIARSLSHLTSV